MSDIASDIAPEMLSLNQIQRRRKYDKAAASEFWSKVGRNFGTDEIRATLLLGAVEIGMVVETDQIRKAGGISHADIAFCNLASWILASQADDLMYRSKGGNKHPKPYCRDAEGSLVFTDAFKAAHDKASVGGENDALDEVDLSTAELCTIVIRCIAIMSFFPGGVRFLGQRFDSNPPMVRVPPGDAGRPRSNSAKPIRKERRR